MAWNLQKGMIWVFTFEYLGGIPDFKKTGKVKVSFDKEEITVKLGSQKVQIPYAQVTGVSLKTGEQISKDVTLTRLLLIGVFAFVAKKKRKETTYGLVIDYDYYGVTTSAIFSGDEVNKAHGELMKKRVNYLKQS